MQWIIWTTNEEKEESCNTTTIWYRFIRSWGWRSKVARSGYSRKTGKEQMGLYHIPCLFVWYLKELKEKTHDRLNKRSNSQCNFYDQGIIFMGFMKEFFCNYGDIDILSPEQNQIDKEKEKQENNSDNEDNI